MKKVLVVGYARSGKFVSLLLQKQGYQVTVTDIVAIPEKEALENQGIFVYEKEHPDFLVHEDWDFVVKNPGIPYHAPFVAKLVAEGQRIITEIEVASWFASNYEYAAITGTNGKTTTTAILGALLQTQYKEAYVAGNIGVPLSELVVEKGNISAKVAVEISGFQLLGVEEFHPSVTTIMNLTPDHLDYFSSLEDYYQTKTLVYHNQREEDWFILNCDDPMVVAYCKNIPCKVIRFSLQEKLDLYLENNQIMLFETCLFEKSDLKIVGQHNLVNAMFAAAMAYKMGVTPENIRRGIQEFMGVEHRIEYVRTVNGIDFYNDSKATNVDSTIVAVQAFEKPLILLAGGYDKKTGFTDLVPYLARLKKLIVFGATKNQFQALREDCIVVDNLEEAIACAYQEAVAGDVILLSPACASYDQYPNFEVRGKQFKEIVAKL